MSLVFFKHTLTVWLFSTLPYAYKISTFFLQLWSWTSEEKWAFQCQSFLSYLAKIQGGGKHPLLPLIVTRLNDISLFYLLKIETKTLCVLQIDFALSVIFILHHLLRLLASSTILAFLLEMVTIVDYFTIPPLLASIWMGRTWIGLRYLLHYTTSTSIYMDG